jgi:hypothetical protein
MEDREVFLIRDERSGELKAVSKAEYDAWKERRRIRREN